jgi:hypothetical protein
LNKEIVSLKQKAITGMEFICTEENKPRIAKAAVTMLNDKYYDGLQAAAKKIAIPENTDIMRELKEKINRPPPAPGPAAPGAGGGRRRTKKSKYYNKRKRTKRRRTKRRRSNKRRN